MKLSVKETAIFSMLGTLMYCSKLIMELLPNIHLVGVLVVAFTVVYRKKALYPIYIFVFLQGIFGGFNAWWVPYLYVWTVLWAVTMLLPEKMSKVTAAVVYAVVCSLHGFLFGILYAPAQALFFGLDFKGMISWIGAGAVFDTVHGISNLLCGVLIMPIISLIRRADSMAGRI